MLHLLGYYLVNAVINGEYKSRNIDIAPDEIFISDGSKCDIANIQEIFDINSTVAITDPVYPVYLDRSYPCSGPYPLKVELSAISFAAFSIAVTIELVRGCVTSPIPILIISAFGLAFWYAFIFFAISAKR